MLIQTAARVAARHAAFSLAGAASLIAFAIPASAQVSDDIVMNILRECARIDDPTARLGCYDNNVRTAESMARNTIPGETVVRDGTGAPLSGSGGVSGFGDEDLRAGSAPARYVPPPPGGSAQADEITATVASVRPREPGIYLVTLEGGAQWLFTDPVDSSFTPPRPGATVEVMRGSLGSFLLRFDQQQPVRVRRIR